jgi:hypothetical protein
MESRVGAEKGFGALVHSLVQMGAVGEGDVGECEYLKVQTAIMDHTDVL